MKIILLILLISSCSPKVLHVNGYGNLNLEKNKINIGDSKQLVVDKIGAPSYVDNDVFYYFKITQTEHMLRAYRPFERYMLKILFKDGKAFEVSYDEKYFTRRSNNWLINFFW